MTKRSRLDVLQTSLQKKNAKVDAAFVVRYMHEIPKDQFPKFRDTANKMILAYKALKGGVVA